VLGEASLAVVSAANALGVVHKYASDFDAAEAAYQVALQLFVLRLLAGCRRTTGVALAATAWAASWAVVILGGHLGAGAEAAFVAAMVIFALGETLFSPTLPAITWL
jgi:hypothetical protein